MSSVEDSDALQLDLNEGADTLTEDTQEEEQVMQQPTQRSGPGTGPKKLGKV